MAIYTFEITELEGEYNADIVALFGEKGDTGTTDYLELINLPDLTLKADKTYVDSQDALKADKTYVDSQDISVASTAQSNLTAHTSNTANPHSTTKSQVGLSNVPNLDTTAAVANQHTHANKAVLDATTASFTTADEAKLDGIATGAQVNTVTSVAGKTGAVTLAKGDVGLGNADNTSDMNKPVSTAQAASIALKADKSTTYTKTEVDGIAGTKATEASGYATTAGEKAVEAGQQAGFAQGYATTASTKATEASGYATTASTKATEASGYAATASTKALEASQSAESANPAIYTTVEAISDIFNADISFAALKNFSITLSDEVSKTIIFSNVPSGRCEIFLELVVSNLSAVIWTLNTGSTLAWASGSAPNLSAGKTYRLLFMSSDSGATWDGFASVGV